jgi:YVTN family beta-propeller protein
MKDTHCSLVEIERLALFGALAIAALGCASESSPAAVVVSQDALENRAYIVSLLSDELTVIDLTRLEIIARIPTGGVSNHMAELNADFTKVYVDSSDTDETVVVDATAFRVVKRIATGRHPTHVSLSRDGRLLAVMDENEGAVSFIDTARDEEVKRLSGFHTPHFMRFSPEGRFGYVANIGAYHLTRVDLDSLEIESHIALDGFQGPPNATEAPDEGGFGDAQIDASGTLYAAHAATGRVLVYDTKSALKLPELLVGARPWIVFAEHPFADLPLRHLVPNFGDRTVSLIDGNPAVSVVAALPGDEEAYGVNFSSQAPNKAFVMNRVRQDVAVVDTASGQISTRIPVGGNTETAATTADGKWIIVAVSSADRVVVIDAVTNEIVKTFENVGRYPWSVTIPRGQNYCH